MSRYLLTSSEQREDFRNFLSITEFILSDKNINKFEHGDGEAIVCLAYNLFMFINYIIG